MRVGTFLEAVCNLLESLLIVGRGRRWRIRPRALCEARFCPDGG